MSKITSNLQVSPQDLFVTSTVAGTDLGAKVTTTDGRHFRYVKAGAVDLVAGTLQQAPAEVANHTNMTVQAAAAIGDTEVSVTLGATAATANQYAGGLLIINDVTGQGYSYEVKSHPAADSAATLTVTLSDPVEVALTTSSQATLIANQYNGVIIHPTASTGAPVGVAITVIAATEYGWIQTAGVVSCLNDASTNIGLGVAPSTNTAGAVMTVAATTNQVGSAVVAGVSTEYNPIDLRLE